MSAFPYFGKRLIRERITNIPIPMPKSIRIRGKLPLKTAAVEEAISDTISLGTFIIHMLSALWNKRNQFLYDIER